MKKVKFKKYAFSKKDSLLAVLFFALIKLEVAYDNRSTDLSDKEMQS